MAKEKKLKTWPKDCIWPMPVGEYGSAFWEADDADSLPLDEEGNDLLEIKEYFDSLVEDGILDDSYKLIDDNPDIDEDWEPEQGEDFWEDDRFDLETWQWEMERHLDNIKLPLPSPVEDIQGIIGYEFANENLLRQAFTRRSFGAEFEIGDSEKLEFVGDSVINFIVTREIARQLAEVDSEKSAEPFHSLFGEGAFSQIRSRFVCKEYLSSRAQELGIDKFMLFGSGEQPSESAREDMMEALIGAVTVDCNWDMEVLDRVVDKLLCIQLSESHTLLSRPFFDIFNQWHQRHFGCMPDYEVYKPASGSMYECILRYRVPENDKGIDSMQRAEAESLSRSQAREYAAEMAYRFVVNNGLWLDLSDSGITPDLENSINQLQELYQKKYVEQPEYQFKEDSITGWVCTCICSGIEDWGNGTTKTQAKKQAVFNVLNKLFSRPESYSSREPVEN